MVSRFLVSMLLAAFTATPATAATFMVTSLADSGPGTLREALAQANVLAGPDRVVFAVTGTLTLTSGEIAITDSVEIVGPGADSLTITPSSFGRIFNIAPATEVTCPDTEPPDAPTTLSGLTLAAGYGYPWRRSDPHLPEPAALEGSPAGQRVLRRRRHRAVSPASRSGSCASPIRRSSATSPISCRSRSAERTVSVEAWRSISFAFRRRLCPSPSSAPRGATT